MLAFKVAELLEKQNWIFAKTMSKIPHWYSLRKTWKKDEEFIFVVEFIRTYGYIDYFFKKKFRYFNINGYKYWTMGAPLRDTTLINRAKVQYQAEYDRIAAQYITLFKDIDSLRENEKLFNKLDMKGKVLDIGCGNGLVLDYCDLKPTNYIGIDKSKEMLRYFKKAHPDYTVINSAFEDYYWEGFDTILALFGTASYFNPKMIHKVKQMIKPDGRIYLMFFKKGYFPITHKLTGCDIPFYECPFKGNLFTNYIIVTEKDLNENIS